MALAVLTVVLVCAVVLRWTRFRDSARVMDGISLVLGIFVTVFVATWDNPVEDRTVYLETYQSLADAASPWDSAWAELDPVFLVLLWTMGHLALPATEVALFAVLGALVYALWWLGLRLNFGSGAAMYGVLSLVAIGFMTAYAGVAVRHGIAIGLVLITIAIVRRDAKWWWVAAVAAVAGGTHWSAWAAFAMVALVWLLRPRLAWLLAVWGAASVLFLTRLTDDLIGLFDMGSGRLAIYASDMAFDAYQGGTGYRLDFFLLSAALGGSLVYLRKRGDPNSPSAVRDHLESSAGVHSRVSGWQIRERSRSVGRRDEIAKYYFALNLLFVGFGFVAFSDRTAMYAWAYGVGALWFGLLATRGRVRSIVVPVGAAGAVALGFVTSFWQMLA